MFDKIKAFFKKEVVFVISFILAAASCFFVKPGASYLGYINVDVLCLLFAFMAVVAGLRVCGVFDKCAKFLCKLTSSVRALTLVLVFMCFLFSMLITNDVALLTFVPFTILLLASCGQTQYLIYVLVLETIGANLGSMLTPMGNPQNLYMYNEMLGTGVISSALDFCKILLPYTIVSAVVLIVCCLFIPNRKLFETEKAKNEFFSEKKEDENQKKGLNIFRTIIYIVLFVVCILSVLKIIPAWILALIIVVCVSSVQAKILLKVDYILLLTFVCFFIFSGNVQNIAVIKEKLQGIVAGNEFLCGILSSQIISNVPATLLLYPFVGAENGAKELILGADFGGLGTIIASLASLISYKLYANSEGADGKKFMGQFTLMSLIFIAVLVGARFVL